METKWLQTMDFLPVSLFVAKLTTDDGKLRVSVFLAGEASLGERQHLDSERSDAGDT